MPQWLIAQLTLHFSFQRRKDGVIPGRLPKLDKLIQQVMVEQGIDDRVLKRHQGLLRGQTWKDSVVEGLAATKKKT